MFLCKIVSLNADLNKFFQFLLCVVNFSGHQGNNGEQNKHRPCNSGAYSLWGVADK